MSETGTNKLGQRLHNDAGAGMAEYVLLMLLIAVALVAAFQGLAATINSLLVQVVGSF